MSYTPELVPIERIQTGFVVYRKGDDFGPFGAHAEVQAVEFDGEGYLVTATFEETDDEDVFGTDQVQFWVRCGDSVRHGGASAPILRQTSVVTVEEWQAKGDAIEADIDRMEGRVAQNVDGLLLATVADVIGVPALMEAAE